jgi:DNA-binding beta-propeller fold protein YncE
MDARTLRNIRDHGDRLRGGASRRFEVLGVAALLLVGCAADEATPADTGTHGPAVMSTASSPPATASTPAPVAQPATMMGAASTPPMQAASNPQPVAPLPATPPGDTQAVPPGAAPVELPVEMGTPTLFWLEIGSGSAYRANADGSGAMQIASGAPLSAPDGVAVDPVDGHVFILNMGAITGGGNNASLVRYKLDGSSPEVIVPPGSKVGDATFNTGKQVTMDPVNRKLYMADREGGKVWRADLDGKNLEVLVSGHGIMQVVGVGTDPTKNQFYFSDKTGHKIFRAGMDMPEGKTHADREDVELLYVDTKARVASSLDIELDLKARRVYWTDKDQNIVFGMSMEMPAGQDAETRTDVDSVVTGMTGVIGLAFDHQESVLYSTHGGSVSSFKTDGSDLKQIGSNGSTGISFVRLP